MSKKGTKEVFEKTVASYGAEKGRHSGMIRKVCLSPEKEFELYRAVHP